YTAVIPWFAAVGAEAARAARLEASHRVLDVAAGPGTLALEIAPQVAHVTAVDFAPGMIEQLRARAAAAAVRNVDAAVMDAGALELEDGAFDAAFCMFGFMFFPDRARAFCELRRVLRPGGRAVIATWGPIDQRPLMKVMFDAMAEVLPDMPRPAKGDLQSVEECVGEMEAGGFGEVSARPVVASVDVASPDAYLEMNERSSPPLLALRDKVGDERYAEVRARLRDAVRRRMPDGPSVLTAQAILTVGISSRA
ncbi:MAG TPA: class I SAM-dependent methyltransferase, partial [Kofleriaceae bacterium]|nr:class I SAM-dependent methyltransferase [Kofleriaceae bacterium]